MNFKDVLWDENDKPSLNEIETRRYFYSSTASAPAGDNFNTIANSTFLEDHISNLDQEKYTFLVGSYGSDEVSTFGWSENKERDDYLRKGLESFDIFDD